MDKTQRLLILTALAVILLSTISRGQELSFRDYDRRSYELYSQAQWKELISLSDEALKQGIDYYYLRVRAGIACFETMRYMKAANHFKKALGFNQGDPLAGEYLYGCYLELNRHADAESTFKTLPSGTREMLKNTLPEHYQADAMAGPLFSNQAEVFDTLDLDGQDNVYGETDIMQDGYYFSAGLSREFRRGYSIYGAYSLIKLNKNKHAAIGDSLQVDDLYPLLQHQVYLSGHIPAVSGFSVTPALSLVLDRYKTVMPQLSEDSSNYTFPVVEFRPVAYLAYLSVDKDFQVVRTGLFAALSNFNDEKQFQAGFSLTAFPFGNLNVYLASRLLNHQNAGKNNIIFDQKVGVRIFRPLWAEVDGTFGRMENYHENNGYVIYNIADAMKFKGGASLVWLINPRLTLTAEYLYLLREEKYLQYQVQENYTVIPVTGTLVFSNQIILAGLKWRF
jgi:tetratricopeptide (TPR) repeat protein